MTANNTTQRMKYEDAIKLGAMRQEEYHPFIENVSEIIIKGGEIFAASALSSLTMSAKTQGNFELLICSDSDFEITDWNINDPQSMSGKLHNINDVIKAIILLTPHLNDYRASLAIAS